MTGNTQDTEEIDLHIVVSGIEAGNSRVHLIETYDGLKPYEECWYAKIPGRWHGKGVTEKLMMLQLWINTIVNIRINRSYVQQLGLFTIRRGSGVTPAMISRLGVNGAVVVNSQDDIKQMVMQEASMASFCQMIENILFQCSVDFCGKHNITVDSSGFDGATIYVPDGLDKKWFCEAMSDFIFKETKNI